ncbi:MAG: macro domain-containing protein [Synergistes sp.]|nr:macro domain-containing protein [Synergistes sp.]
MSFEIIHGDITKVKCDAIVNAANSSLSPGGGVCGAIFKAAGYDEMCGACKSIGGVKTGDAVITPGFSLPAKYVIHTAGPVWRGGDAGEAELLASCYKNSLLLADKNGCSSIAFPLISSGVYGCPYDEALRIAEQAIKEFLKDHSGMAVTLVLFGK